MTIDTQLRAVARRADQHQPVITTEEIIQRVSGRGTRTSPRPIDRQLAVDHNPTGSNEEEATMIDLETSSHTDGRRKRTKLILIGSLAAAAGVAVIAVVAIRHDDVANTRHAADGARILAKGTDVEFVGEDGLASQTLNVDAEEQGGNVTGQFRIGENVIDIECADTNRDGYIILGGTVSSGPDVKQGDLLALVIKVGTPDRANLVGNESNADSCAGMLANMSADNLDVDNFAVVEDGYDIQTG